ncbi:YbgC/FadM family acyl-CoA thioesterase [Phenylobacterium sp.]|uniref:acyl-CoA thioesterase n=1 Tax=Phenylobacterium sp. TaxID=1871053 RepID=UPI0025D0CFFB|nr:YbgC/FadM family acyl-CoA thioesterase [Phenylobacterium sp.]
MDVRIYYQDTDCGNVVYYGNYLRYFEQGRTHWLEQQGLSVKAFMDAGTLFAVVRAEVFYRSPARYGETLSIATRLTEMRAASFTFAHEIREKTSGRLVVEGGARLATVDLQGKLTKLPKALRERLAKAMGAD